MNDLYIKKLFADCNDLRNDLSLVFEQVQDIIEISMNAHVASGQTGVAQKIFTEIANQISKTANSIESLSNQIFEEVNALALVALNVFRINKRLKKYETCFVEIEGEYNKILFQKTLDRHKNLIVESELEIFNHFITIHSLLKHLYKQHYRLFGAAQNLSVGSIYIEDFENTALFGLISNLNQSTDKGMQSVYDIQKRVKRYMLEAKEYDPIAEQKEQAA